MLQAQPAPAPPPPTVAAKGRVLGSGGTPSPEPAAYRAETADVGDARLAELVFMPVRAETMARKEISIKRALPNRDLVKINSGRRRSKRFTGRIRSEPSWQC